MDWTLYTPSNMEHRMNLAYRKHGIHRPSDMDLERIAAIFQLEIACTPGPSLVCWDSEFGVIFLNEALPVKEKRSVFFHELCHPLCHAGNQWNMPQRFLQLQETQAAAFQAYAAVPCYMLEQYGCSPDVWTVDTLSEDFLLPEELIRRRLDQIKRRILQAQSDLMLQQRISGKPYLHPDFFCEEARVPYVCQPA